MHPVAAVLLPVAAVALVGTTVSAPPALVGSTVQAVPSSSGGPDRLSGVSAGPSGDSDVWSRTSDRPVPSAGPTLRAATASDNPALRGRWAWPLQPVPAVVRRFLPPATKYGAGHRGVDLEGTGAQVVRAVEAGTVTHVGRIAGRGTVTVLHSSGIRSTYEPVDPRVSIGAVVARGASLGRLEAAGSHCGPSVCLHLGAIRGATYLDPMALIVGGRRVRLLPLGQAPEG